MQCDKDSFVIVETPSFCCKNPRIQIGGEIKKAKAPRVCGDLKAEFDQGNQKIRYVRGPATTAGPQQLDNLLSAGLGKMVPSPIAMQALRDSKEWSLIAGTKCKGRDGTLLEWTGTGRVELCPTGTTPVGGEGYSSWQCDEGYKEEVRLFCCSVKGRVKCVRKLNDKSAELGCRCQQSIERLVTKAPGESRIPLLVWLALAFRSRADSTWNTPWQQGRRLHIDGLRFL